MMSWKEIHQNKLQQQNQMSNWNLSSIVSKRNQKTHNINSRTANWIEKPPKKKKLVNNRHICNQEQYQSFAVGSQ